MVLCTASWVCSKLLTHFSPAHFLLRTPNYVFKKSVLRIEKLISDLHFDWKFVCQLLNLSHPSSNSLSELPICGCNCSEIQQIKKWVFVYRHWREENEMVFYSHEVPFPATSDLRSLVAENGTSWQTKTFHTSNAPVTVNNYSFLCYWLTTLNQTKNLAIIL